MEADTRGHVSELLAKCMAQGALDQDFSAEDKERMMTFLRTYGDLDRNGKFTGGSSILGRAGFMIPPAAGAQVGVVEPVLDMKTLLNENLWNGLLFTEEWHQQATMMQCVGGNDQIPMALARDLGSSIHYDSPVKSFKRSGQGVSVSYTQGGKEKNLEADYCIIALPFEILKRMDNDLSPAFKSVVTGSTPAGSYKIAWESRRFWEQDYNIYGGLSWLAQGPSPVWYPSANLQKETGVVVCGYKEEQNTPFWSLSMEEKFAASRASMEKLHPGHGKELTKPCYVGWRKIKWSEASWLGTWGGGRAGYNVIIEADGPYYLAGDGVSNINAWMEGAALSAKRAVQMISDRVKTASA
jgi:monoamine oxidase